MNNLDSWLSNLKQEIASNKETIQSARATTEYQNNNKVFSVSRLKSDYSQILPHEVPPLG